MSGLVDLAEILLDYDGPALSLVRDERGNHHLAYQATAAIGSGCLIALPISETRLKGVVDGVLDVRTAIESSSLFPNFFLLSPVASVDGTRWASRLYERGLADDEIPGRGLYLEPAVSTHSLAALVLQRMTTVARLSLYPPEAEQRQVIAADTLADALKALQRLLRRALPHVSKRLAASESAQLRTVQADSLDVFGFAPGSFEVLLEPRAGPDLFARSDSVHLLSDVSNLFDAADSIQETIILLRQVKGHYASAYVRFLEVLVSRGSPAAFAWMDRASEKPRSARIEVQQAVDLLAAIRESKELEVQEVRIVGVLEQADVVRKRWRLRDSDGEAFSGETEDLRLDGLRLGDSYSFRCREVIEEEAGTGKETLRLIALSIDP